MKLNLGCGNPELYLAGYENWDRKNGHEAYPLDVPDNSIEEIRASHVLEHFGWREVGAVVAHWVSKLQPGGLLKIAVPDFGKIAEDHVAGGAENPCGFLMGGQEDEDDFHRVLFDRPRLFDVMAKSGLERIGSWASEGADCATHRYSLNLKGFKRTSNLEEIPRGAVYAILAAPRYGPVSHFRCCLKVMHLLGIPWRIATGCYWHQLISQLMEECLTPPHNPKYALALDYDTMFSTSDVMELYRVMEAFPEVDALASVQAKRHSNTPLAIAFNQDGTKRDLRDYAGGLMQRVSLAHFGLTMIRCTSLAKLPRPWMMPTPDADGRWGDGKVDADISFWVKWADAGLSLHLANRVVVGHMSESIEWPGHDFKTVYQALSDYEKNGIPSEVVR